MSTPPFEQKGRVLERVLALCATLRAPGGCPWDREQTLSTLTPYLIEEAHETAEAVAGGKPADIREELGDLLFVTIFALHAAETEGVATVEDIVEHNIEKLVRRHPHVFGEEKSQDTDVAREAWQRAKRAEGGDDEPPSVLGTYIADRPSIINAFRMQERASAVGFDWPDLDGPLDKTSEELEELREAIHNDESADRVGDELGDLLFAVVNVSRFLKIDPEQVLRRTNRRFYDRFRFVEAALRAEGRTPEQSTIDEMERLWQAAKADEGA
jgi:MazG family protein